MFKRLTRKLLIVSVLVGCLTLVVPSTPAQGSGYWLYGSVNYGNYVVGGSVTFYKWNGSSWVFHGYANASCAGYGYYSYDTGGPGYFMGEVNGWYPYYTALNCSYQGGTNMCGSSIPTELSAGHPSAWMPIGASPDYCGPIW